MASKTEYQLNVKLGATTSSSWKTTLGKAEAALSGLNSLSNKVMAGIAAGATAAAISATAVMSSAVEKYADFESEMATVKSISEATAQQFLGMKDVALDAGRSTVFTATESASALEYMSLAGWDVNESIAGLTPMLKLAAATGVELQTTSDLVTDSMSALGLEVMDLDMYLDKLVKGNNKANNTAEQFMEGLVESGGAARTLGADLDDTVTALGKLADNGTKGAEGGTALNAIFGRLAGNTTTLKELSKLDIDLWDEGKFIGFEESLIRINDALSGLTDEDRAMSLKNIAGTNYFSQMSYLLDAVTEVTDENGNVVTAWQELETEVANSAGALENMYDITTDTLLFAQKRLTSAKEDMQIRVADVFADDAKDFLLWLSEKMPQATDSIVEFAEAHRGEFADALESLGEGIEWLWENGIAAGQWIIKHKGAIKGGLIGIASAFGLVKAALLGINIAKFFANPLTAIPAIAVAAAAGIGAVAGAIKDAETAAVNANLAAHFGSISLSMSEIEDVAQRIVSSDHLTGVLSALEEFDELDSFSDKMDDAVKALKKMNWKVSIGLELTEGEAEEYQRAIEDFIKNAQEYALQAQYSVSLSMDFAFSDADLEQSNLVAKVNQFYADKYQELSDLGTKLNKAVTDAFNDGLLDPLEMDAIARIQADMAEVEKALAVGDYQAELSMLELEYSGKELTSETIISLMEKLDEKSADATEAYRTAYGKNYSAITAAHAGGALTDEEYASGIQALQDELARETAELQMQSMQFLLNTINSGYANEIRQYQDTVAASMDLFSDTLYDTDWSEHSAGMYDQLIDYIIEGGPDKTSKKAMAELLGTMEGTIDEIFALRGQWDNLTPEMQQTLEEMFTDINQLRAMTAYDSFWGQKGDVQSVYSDVANKANDSDGHDNIKAYVQEEATRLQQMFDYSNTVQQEAKDMYAYTQDCLDQAFSEGVPVTTDVLLTANPIIKVNGMGDKIKPVELMSNAAGGIYDRPILTTFAEEGPEAAVPLDGSVRAKSIWARAGQMLGMLPQGSRDQSLLAGVSGGGGQWESGTERSIQVSLNPVITIQGNASKEDIHGALAMTVNDLREMLPGMLAEIERENRRTSFG